MAFVANSAGAHLAAVIALELASVAALATFGGVEWPRLSRRARFARSP